MLASGFGRHRRVRRCGAPGDAAARHLKPGTVDVALIDGVANVDVGVAVAVRAHVARRREAGLQVGLEIVDRDEHRPFRRHARRAVVEHVGVRVDQAGQDRRLTQVDHLSSGRNLDLRLRPDVGDPLTEQEHHLLRQHLAADAVEQAAGTHRHRLRRREDIEGLRPQGRRTAACRQNATVPGRAAEGASPAPAPAGAPRTRPRQSLHPSQRFPANHTSSCHHAFQKHCL